MMRRTTRRRTFTFAIIFLFAGLSLKSAAGDDRQSMLERFANPPGDCHPQTRWWWMGNALTKEDISWQLREMHRQGIRGVEQISMEPVYEKGNVPYLSDEYFDLLKHTVRRGRRARHDGLPEFRRSRMGVGGRLDPAGRTQPDAAVEFAFDHRACCDR